MVKWLSNKESGLIWFEGENYRESHKMIPQWFSCQWIAYKN
jgi:hypothetical protein